MNERRKKPGAGSQEPETRRFRLVATGYWLLAPLFLFGCDYGVGGTGELVIPREKLHEFSQMQLQPAPTTEPATLPTTAPAAEPVELTIEQVRRDALENNLDLKVQLFDPTI